MIIEPKPQDAPSASWRPRKAGGVVPVQTWAENQGLMVSQSQSEGQRTSRTDRCPSSSRGGIFPSFDYIEASTASVQLPSGKLVDLHFCENNVEITDSYECKSIEDCYAVIFAIKVYARENGIEIIRSNADMAGELRLHNFLYEIGYKQNETGTADVEYIRDRRWYVNVASRMIGWTGL